MRTRTAFNDAFFIASSDRNNTQWGDIPASYHNGACGFSFADGHAEIRKWKSASSIYKVQYQYPATKVFHSAGQANFASYNARVGFAESRTGLPANNS